MQNSWFERSRKRATVRDDGARGYCTSQCLDLHLLEQAAPLHEYVAAINKAMEPLGMKVSLGKKEQDGSEWLGLVNTVRDAAAKKATSFSPVELEYFKKIVSLDNSAFDVC